MGWCESEFGSSQCEKHLNHRHQPGVCPACLRNKLLNLTSTLSSCSSSLSCSPPPPYSSSSSSTGASPPLRRHQRIGSDVASSISFILDESTSGLRKSRSMAVTAKTQVRDVEGRKKKSGFWSKLLRSTGKRTKEVFGHSHNLKESFEYCY